MCALLPSVLCTNLDRRTAAGLVERKERSAAEQTAYTVRKFDPRTSAYNVRIVSEHHQGSLRAWLCGARRVLSSHAQHTSIESSTGAISIIDDAAIALAPAT